MGEALLDHALNGNAVAQALVFLDQMLGLVDHKLVNAQHLADHRRGDPQQADVFIEGAFVHAFALDREHADGGARFQNRHGDKGHAAAAVV